MAFIIHVSALVEDDGRFLFVREGKEKNYGKLNLPGGHLNEGEELQDGVRREVREETGLEVAIEDLVGLYTGLGEPHYLHLVFTARVEGGQLMPQQGEIIECQWLWADELFERGEEEILNPNKLRVILQDYHAGARTPLALIRENIRG
ncbi:MAG: NUDIX domain-containing protein [Candidatus Latescibacterota bacterium]|jgi:ADP-ribose pyrophosphatase YjhB (NUDIX family)|tara:strand:- start:2 stop:445 length:444 start_codon:yes stop_codon:yes gene_type:complete